MTGLVHEYLANFVVSWIIFQKKLLEIASFRWKTLFYAVFMVSVPFLRKINQCFQPGSKFKSNNTLAKFYWQSLSKRSYSWAIPAQNEAENSPL